MKISGYGRPGTSSAVTASHRIAMKNLVQGGRQVPRPASALEGRGWHACRRKTRPRRSSSRPCGAAGGDGLHCPVPLIRRCSCPSRTAAVRAGDGSPGSAEDELGSDGSSQKDDEKPDDLDEPMGDDEEEIPPPPPPPPAPPAPPVPVEPETPVVSHTGVGSGEAVPTPPPPPAPIAAGVITAGDPFEEEDMAVNTRVPDTESEMEKYHQITKTEHVREVVSAPCHRCMTAHPIGAHLCTACYLPIFYDGVLPTGDTNGGPRTIASTDGVIPPWLAKYEGVVPALSSEWPSTRRVPPLMPGPC